MTKKPNRPEHLPRLRRFKERRVLAEMMLGLDDLFRATLGKFDTRYVLEMRHVFQRVLACHLKDETTTAHEMSKASGLSRETVRRILDDFIRIGWLDRSGSHFWISTDIAKSPPVAYDKATKLVIAAANELRSQKKK